jgi:hypothetical protein
MDPEQFLQTRAGNWSKVAMRHPSQRLKFFQPPTYGRSSGLTPHKRPLGQHSRFCVRLFDSITPLGTEDVQFCSF